MLDSLRSKSTREIFVRLLPMIVLMSIVVPVVMYMNVKSINLYLLTIKLRGTVDEVFDETTKYIHNLKTKSIATKQYPTNTSEDRTNDSQSATMAKIYRKLFQSSAIVVNASSTRSMEREFSNLTTSTSRPLTCDGCFFFEFQFLIENKDICKSDGEPIEILILITSAPQNYLARKTIRETWLMHTNQNSGKIRYAFLIGKSRADLEVRKENNFTKDIILGNFHDAYSNLTFKTLMGYYWTLHYCKNAKFIMKTDDDMYVNIPGLTKTVNQNSRALQTAVGGYCHLIGQPIRDKNSKWYASFQSYPQKTYPGFCSGTGYITSINVVSKIVNISKNIPFFHLEDVYVSLCVRKIGYRLHPMTGFMARLNPCKNDFVTVHQVSLKRMRDFWNTPCANANTRL